MLTLPAGARIYLAVTPVDMRKGFDCLCAVVMKVLEQNPLEGHLFRGKSGDRIKTLWWDRNGLVIWCKRLKNGCFKSPHKNAKSLDITEFKLSLLLDGIDFTRLKKLPNFHAEFSF